MAEVYRAKIAKLADALSDEHERTEAAEIIRGLIDRIVLTPKEGRSAPGSPLAQGSHRRGRFGGTRAISPAGNVQGWDFSADDSPAAKP
jgi:hypothetical protein